MTIGHSNSVLVVDDRGEIRLLLKVALGKQVQVHEACNGEEALASIRRFRPAVVLLDVMMPGPLSGLDVLEQVRADPGLAGTLVAVITARAQLSDRRDAEAKGADAFFVKPFSPQAVVAWVMYALQAGNESKTGWPGSLGRNAGDDPI